MNANGTGSFYARKLKKLDSDGDPIIVYDVRYRDNEGKSQTKRGFKGKKAAQAFLNDITAKLSTETYVRNNKYVISQVADKWYDEYKSTVRVNTASWHYYNLLHIKRMIGAYQIQKFTSAQVVKFLYELKQTKYGKEELKPLSATTIINIRRTLDQLLDYAIEGKYINKNVCKDKKVRNFIKQLKKDNPSFKGTAIAQVSIIKLIESQKSPHARLAIALAGLLGLRLGEIKGLREGNIDRVKKVINIVKQLDDNWELAPLKTPPSERSLRCHSYILSLIDDVIIENRKLEKRNEAIPSDLLMIHTANKQYLGNPYSDSHYGDILTDATTKTGIESIRFHDLRHSYGSNLIYLRIPIITVSRLMGHANPEITLSTYAHEIEDCEDEMYKEIEDKISSDLLEIEPLI